MAAIERIADWIDILEEHKQDAPLELCPTEVVHLMFDLHIIRETVLAYERHLDVYSSHCQCPDHGHAAGSVRPAAERNGEVRRRSDRAASL